MKEVKKPRKPVLTFYLIMLGLLLVMNMLVVPSMMRSKVMEVDYGTFLKALDDKAVRTVQVETDAIYFITGTEEEPQFFVTAPFNDADLVDRLYESGCKFGQVVAREPSPIVSLIVNWVLPVVIFFAIGQLLTRSLMKRAGGGSGIPSMQFGKSNAKIYVASTTSIKLKDVAGEEEAKEALSEIVDFLHNPDKYRKIGAKLPKGALLVGPPGTGKTLLAKAVAGEAGVPFFFVSGSAFVEMFVGTGAARVRDLFKQAAAKAPCIVFIDEIDAIGKKRDSSGIGGNDEREQTLNQLLAEMDGFDPEKGIMVLGATNRPEILDKALLRPGRFDRRIPVELPDMKGRLDILEVHAKKKKLEPFVELKRVADATPGASGAELANILNEAALAAVRDGRSMISQADLDHATEYVIAGSEKKSMVISPEEKRIIAYHEIGHALVAAKQKNVVPIRKITIIPRTSGALGFTMQADEEEHVLMKKEDLIQQLQVLTAGRAAEELIFGTCTSGASNDIERATSIARSMVTRFGMNDEIGLMALDTVVNPYLDAELRSNASQEAAARVEKEMRKLIQDAYDAATEILKDNAATLNRLSQYLLENENITGDEFMALLKQDELPAAL